MNREAIVTALCDLVFPVAAFETTGRRVLFWTAVKAQPACFIRNVGDHYPSRPTGFPPIRTIDCEIWLYSNAGVDPEVAPGTGLNNLIDAVEAVLQVPPGLKAQTLNGQVTHCWIEGAVEMDPGDLDGQAKAVIPVKILVP